jgi:hypothetical protein
MFHNTPQAKNRSRFPVVFRWREWNSTARPAEVHTRPAAPCACRSSHSEPKRSDADAAQATAMVRLLCVRRSRWVVLMAHRCATYLALLEVLHASTGDRVPYEYWIEIFNSGVCILFINGGMT